MDFNPDCLKGQYHVADTAGVGYCVRCEKPSGEVKHSRPLHFDDRTNDDIPTWEDDHLEDEGELLPRLQESRYVQRHT